MKNMLTIGALAMALALTVGCKKKDENAAASGSASTSAAKVENKPTDKPTDKPADKATNTAGGDTATPSTGSPECDEYLKAFDDMANKCKDKLGPAFDGMKQARDAQADAFKQWANLDETAKKAAREAAAGGCKSATDALKESASAMGCTL